MNRRIRVISHRRRAWRPPAGIAAATIATAALALPAPAFGSRPSSAVAGGSSTTRRSALSRSTNTQAALAFSRCMRSHGVRNFADPNSSGLFPKRTAAQLGVSTSRFESAQTACSHLLPNGGLPPGVAPTQAELRKMERDGAQLPPGACALTECRTGLTTPSAPGYPFSICAAPASPRIRRGSWQRRPDASRCCTCPPRRPRPGDPLKPRPPSSPPPALPHGGGIRRLRLCRLVECSNRAVPAVRAAQLSHRRTPKHMSRWRAASLLNGQVRRCR